MLFRSKKLELLETIDVAERLRKVTAWMREVLAEIAVRERIREDVSENMEKTQKEFLLRRQLDAIRKELGELEGSDGDEIARYRERIDESEMTDEARKEALREVDRLEAGAQGPESSTIRTYLDTLLEVPWGVSSEESGDVDLLGEMAGVREDHAVAEPWQIGGREDPLRARHGDDQRRLRGQQPTAHRFPPLRQQ